jgi:hypothetical protein
MDEKNPKNLCSFLESVFFLKQIVHQKLGRQRPCLGGRVFETARCTAWQSARKKSKIYFLTTFDSFVIFYFFLFQFKVFFLIKKI